MAVDDQAKAAGIGVKVGIIDIEDLNHAMFMRLTLIILSELYYCCICAIREAVVVRNFSAGSGGVFIRFLLLVARRKVNLRLMTKSLHPERRGKLLLRILARRV